MLKRAPVRNGLDPAALFAPLAPFAHIGLAVSGGPDSLALMVLAAEWAKSQNKVLTVYTVDHGLRAEAAAECAMVKTEAERLGLACRVLNWTGDKPETGIQAAARAARYRLIGAAMQEDGTEILVTAHHRDDQAETVLMRMAHGSGFAGLAGMALFGSVEGVRLCRPLLDVPGDTLRDSITDSGLTPALDPSNTDNHYERVRWRGLLPALAAQGLNAARFGTLANRVARADRALVQWAEDAFGQLADIDAFGVVTLPVDRIFALPEEIGLRVLAQAVAWAGGGQDRNRLGPLETAFETIAKAEPGFALTLAGAVVQVSAQSLQVFREAGRLDENNVTLASKTTIIWDKRFTFTCEFVQNGRLSLMPAGDLLTRAELEAIAGPVTAPMRAIAAAPVLRDDKKGLFGIGTIVLPGTGVVSALTFKTKPSPSRQNPGNQNDT